MPAEHLTFFLDTMLGRLARWLRLLGYDAAYENEIGDWELIRRSGSEDRILLTRDRDVMRRWQIARGRVVAFLVSSSDIMEQIVEVATEFGLQPRPEARCPQDNSDLNTISREEARGRVPPYVFKTQKDFHFCPACGRIFWKATHWERIEQIRGRLA
ncbi:MAG: Mut7-C RNAse domain-containing protein [Thermoleophilia bacterium]|nr:Mut7-C RNAse domain-containing protein [Thermoleophilia bacterium]